MPPAFLEARHGPPRLIQNLSLRKIGPQRLERTPNESNACIRTIPAQDICR